MDEPDVPAPLLHHQAPQVVAQHTLSLPTPVAYLLLPMEEPRDQGDSRWLCIYPEMKFLDTI